MNVLVAAIFSFMSYSWFGGSALGIVLSVVVATVLCVALWLLYRWIRTLRRRPNPLQSLVREAKWRAVDMAVSDIAAVKGLRISAARNSYLYRLRRFVGDQIGDDLGRPRDAQSNFSNVDRELFNQVHVALGRDATVGGKFGERVADQILQEIWDREFAGPKGKGVKPLWEDLPPEEDGMRLFLTGFRDPREGWLANFQAIMHNGLGDPQAKAAARQLQTFLGVENRSLVTGMDERLRRIEALTKPPPLPLNRLARFDDTATGTQAYVPFTFRQRNTELVGREDELEKLHQFLDSSAPFSWWQICGFGGQGKSRLALHLVDTLGAPWHAGFLAADDLEKQTWNTVEFPRPTLCVIDYVSAPAKAEAVAKAIRALHERVHGGLGEGYPAPECKVRFLVLERAGYDLRTAGSTALRADWFGRLQSRVSAYAEAARCTAHRKKALELNDLDDEAMLRVANSWREKSQDESGSNRDLLTTDQQTALIAALRGSPNTGRQSDRAWRPLFAMMYAALLDDPARLRGGGIEEFLELAFDDEQRHHWQRKDGEVIEPSSAATNLACLATIAGELPLDSATLRRADANGSSVADPFYNASCDKTLTDAWMTLGQRLRNPQGPHGTDFVNPLFAREPDLMGEYMVIWALSQNVRPDWPPPGSPERIERLIRDGIEVNGDATISFLTRLGEDFPANPVTNALAAAPMPGFEDRISISDAAARGLSYLVRRDIEQDAGPDVADERNILSLILAAQNGHVEVVQILLSEGADADCVNEKDGLFPLLQAAQEGHVEVARVLLKEGADAERINRQNGTFPLLQAAQDGHLEVVRMLLSEGAEADRVNENQGTFPLLQAAQNGHVEVVRMLLSEGGKADRVNEKDGLFPLLQAAQQGHVEVVRVLLNAGVDANRVSEQNGLFPLLQAAQNGHLEVVCMLLGARADANRVNEQNGDFPLLRAVQNCHVAVVEMLLSADAAANRVNPETGVFPLLVAADKGYADVVKLLLDKEAETDLAHEIDGSFPLVLAAQNGHEKVVAMLLSAGADVDRVAEQNGLFPLVLAAQNGHVEVVSMLLNKGADADRVNEQNGAFSLLVAAQNGHAKVVHMLLNAVANTDRASEQNGAFPLVLAAENGHEEVVRMLLSAGADADRVNEQNGLFPLLQAAQNGHVEVVSMLLNKGADAHQVNEQNGTFPLLQAVQDGHMEVVRMLLSAGADANRMNEQNGDFPLLRAVQKCHVDVVEMLLNADAAANHVNPETGVFPLLIAAEKGYADVVKLLLDKEAETDLAHEIDGSFPLEVAAQSGHEEVVAMLLRAGADADRVNEKNGLFPLFVAALEGHYEIVKILLAAGATPDRTRVGPSSTGTFTAAQIAREEGHDDIADLIESWPRAGS